MSSQSNPISLKDASGNFTYTELLVTTGIIATFAGIGGIVGGKFAGSKIGALYGAMAGAALGASLVVGWYKNDLGVVAKALGYSFGAALIAEANYWATHRPIPASQPATEERETILQAIAAANTVLLAREILSSDKIMNEISKRLDGEGSDILKSIAISAAIEVTKGILDKSIIKHPREVLTKIGVNTLTTYFTKKLRADWAESAAAGFAAGRLTDLVMSIIHYGW